MKSEQVCVVCRLSDRPMRVEEISPQLGGSARLICERCYTRAAYYYAVGGDGGEPLIILPPWHSLQLPEDYGEVGDHDG